MPDRLKAILEKIKEWWLKFTTKQKTLLISITAVVILALVILAVVMTKPTMVQLITCEDATQASSVKDLLDGNSIDYEVSSDGMTFSVNAKNQADANILLGSNSIPTNGFTIDDALTVLSHPFSPSASDTRYTKPCLLKTYTGNLLLSMHSTANETEAVEIHSL